MNVHLNVTENSRVIRLVLSGTGVRGASGAAGFTADEIAAIQGANAPDADNVFATIADVESGVAGVASFEGRVGAVTATAGDYQASEITVDASGFNGNLTTADNTVQKVAQKVDDLVAGAGSGDVSDGDTLTTGLTFPLAGLHILDTNASHDLILSPGSNLTADRTLTLTTGDADRTLTIGASASVAGTNTGDQDLSGYSLTSHNHSGTYDPAGTAASAVSAHAGAADPHTVYALESSLGGAALLSVGTTTGTVAAGDDSRLSDARTPTSHVHGNISNAGAIGSTANLPVITTTSGVLTAGAFGNGATNFCVGNDSRLSDARTPTAHAASHASGQSDAIKLDDLAAPDDNTDLNASTTKHGLLPKLSNVSTEYLSGTGVFSTPAGGSATQAFGTIVVSGQSNVVADAAPDTLTLVAGTQITLTTDAGADSVTITGTGAAASHAHGNITSAGAIGSTANLPVITTTSGVLTAGAFGTGATDFCVGNDARLSDARTPAAHNQAETTITFTDVTTGNASTTAHGFSPKATAPAAGLVNVVGIANGETAYTNKALFDTTNPAALGSVGPGTAVIAARRDHVHANPAIDTLAAATDITTLNTSTTAHGLAPKAVAPSSGQLNALGIANGETAIANKTIFDGLLQVRVITEAAYQALGAGRPSTTLYIRT
jgi:hypothetical protein